MIEETWVTEEGRSEMRDDGVAREPHKDGDDADSQEWAEEGTGGEPTDEGRHAILVEVRMREGNMINAATSIWKVGFIPGLEYTK